MMAIEKGKTRVFLVVAPFLELLNCSTFKPFWKVKKFS
jgi:hypothetical protein